MKLVRIWSDFHHPTKSASGWIARFMPNHANYCVNSDNLPMQPIDCLTDVEPTVYALLEPAHQ